MKKVVVVVFTFVLFLAALWSCRAWWAEGLYPLEASILNQYKLTAPEVPEEVLDTILASGIDQPKYYALFAQNYFYGGKAKAFLNEKKEEKLNELKRTLRKALKLDPTKGVNLSILGMIEFELGNTHDALTSLAMALDVEPKSYLPHLYYAGSIVRNIWSLEKDSRVFFVKVAIDEMEIAQSLYPLLVEDSYAISVLSDLYSLQGKQKQALQILWGIATQKNASPFYQIQLAKGVLAVEGEASASQYFGSILKERFNDKRAYHTILNALIAATEQHAESHSLHMLLGKNYFERGEDEKAIISFRTAISLNYSLAEAHYFLGNLYEKRGEYSMAHDEYVITLQCNENYEKAKEKIIKLQYRNLGHFLKDS